jgi:hypothetical protein
VPYRDGHWSWIEPWGWTWVDDAPWGFAVSHYGRWTQSGGAWGWVPGPVASRAYYAPALVVFIGGANFQISLSSGAVSGVGWFPLAPREVYRPSYPVSRSYYDQLNRSNTVVNTTIINNTYNNTTINVGSFANHRVPGAVIAVPKTAFVQSQPVARVAMRPVREAAADQPLAFAPPVAPIESSVRGGAARRDQPPARVFDKPVVVRNAPPAAPPSLAQQLPKLGAQPGKPLDETTRKQIAPATSAAHAPPVRLATPPKEVPRAMPARPADKGAVEPTPRTTRVAPEPPAAVPGPRETAQSRLPVATVPAQPAPRAIPEPPAAKPAAADKAPPRVKQEAPQPPAKQEMPQSSEKRETPQPPAKRETPQPSEKKETSQPPAKQEAPQPSERKEQPQPPVKREMPQPSEKKEQAQAPAAAADRPVTRAPAPKEERGQASRPGTGKPDVPKKNEKDEDGADPKKPRDRKAD